MITLGIIEDDRFLRHNIEECINMVNDVLLIFSYNSMEVFFEKIAETDEPYIILIDLGLPGISGLEGITYIRKHWNDVHIVVITGNDDENIIFDCILTKAFQDKRVARQYRYHKKRRGFDNARGSNEAV